MNAPPHGWRVCDGSSFEYVGGRGRSHWWRCSACRWVGWVTTAHDRPPKITTHHANED